MDAMDAMGYHGCYGLSYQMIISFMFSFIHSFHSISCHTMAFHSILCHSFLPSFMYCFVLQFVLSLNQSTPSIKSAQIRSNQNLIESNQIQSINQSINTNQPSSKFRVKTSNKETCNNVCNTMNMYEYC